jgi:hypothetical protein
MGYPAKKFLNQQVSLEGRVGFDDAKYLWYVVHTASKQLSLDKKSVY